jgi:hypothetical protein
MMTIFNQFAEFVTEDFPGSEQAVPPLWVAPTGSIGAWMRNDEVEHNGYRCRNTSDNNSFAPGVWGWTNLGLFNMRSYEKLNRITEVLQ